MIRLWFLAAFADGATRLVSQSQVERLGLRLYDFACGESEKHTCACQLRCPDRRQCARAMETCLAHAPLCEYVVLNPSGEWATLKRGANAAEEAELYGYEEKWWTEERYAAERPRLEAEGERRRNEFQAAGGFAAAISNRSLAIGRTLRDGSPLCGTTGADAADWLVRASPTVGLVALSYKTPATLRRSMRSWLAGGLLHVVDERIALLNDPSPAERAICVRHGFDVRTPASFAGEPHLRTARRDVFTIGVSFAAAMTAATTDYVLFLEKDFAIDPGAPVVDELAASVAMLERGAALVRLRSIKDQGCGTFRRCQNDTNMPDWKATTTFFRRRNWWSFYCRDFERPANVADCARDTRLGLHFRCFTSWDSNWSLNAIIIDRRAALEKKWRIQQPPAPGVSATRRKISRAIKRSLFQQPNGLTLAEYGAATWNKQDGFEVGMLRDDWGALKMPLCISLRGLFRHVEVDG